MILCIIVFPAVTYGQTPGELNYRLVPNKILENSDIVLQVYAKGDVTPKNIENLIVKSSDSSIIKISSIEQDQSNFFTNVKIKTGNPGTANIALAAPGFSSQEIPVIVYSNNNAPTKLLITTTPSKFSTIGPATGYVSVELVNNDNFPTKAIDDTIITLSASDSKILTLKNSQMIIKKGEYFTTAQFEVKQDGSVQISASAPLMQTVSSMITVSTAATPQTIHLFVYPTNINSYSNSNAYVIVQLLDSAGNLVQATNDIPVSVQITDTSNTAIINTSGQTPLMSADEQLLIKKGSYWGYSKLTVNAGTTDTFSISILSKGHLVSAPITVTPTPGQLYDTKSAKLDVLPILATGNKELIGVLHLEDNNGKPVIVSTSFQTKVDSSDTASLSIDNVQMDQGTDAALVFGNVGITIPGSIILNVETQNIQTVTPSITLPTKQSLTLVSVPLIPRVLSYDNYPVALYMVDGNDALTTFPQDLNTFIPTNDYLQTESTILPKDQSIVLLNTRSLKEGTSTVSVTAGDFQSNIQVNNLSSKPSSIFIDYPSTLLSNLRNTFSIQLLNSQQLPVFTDHDLELKLVSSNPSVLNVPDSVIIKKDEYYSLFSVDGKNAGTTELAVLSDELPLVKYDISVTNLIPDVTMSSPDYMDQNVVLHAKVIAQYHGVPLNQMKVDWEVKGAVIQTMDSITDKDGNANLSVLVQDPTAVDIRASVSGGVYGVTTAEKSIKVNPPLERPALSTTGNVLNTDSFNILGLNPLFVIIPVAVAAAGGIVILKKKNMLDGITEKISIMEKVTEIKDKFSQMREK